ncbi:MAG: TolB family protein, partial [Marinirhabdus sp.]
MKYLKRSLPVFLLLIAFGLSAQPKNTFEPLDVFQLEYAGDPQISPDGKWVVYRRTGFDIMKDRPKGDLWIVHTEDPAKHYKLTNREGNERQARWSPDSKRIAFVGSSGAGSEIYIHWLENGALAKLTQLENSPSNLAWSPTGNKIAFTMKVAAKPPVIAKMPQRPKGAKWAAKARITDRLKHEADGAGYIKPGFTHIFTVPAQGGTPRQWTSGDRNHGGRLSWGANGNEIYFSANLAEDWEYDFRNSEVYALNLVTAAYVQLTDRNGPDRGPVASPDGRHIAYLGYRDKVQAYQISPLQLMQGNGRGKRTVTKNLDRSIKNPVWAKDGRGLYFMYEDRAKTKIAHTDLNGNSTDIVDNVGGTSLGRPYPSGGFTVSDKGKIAYTISRPDRPADIAIVDRKNTEPKLLTRLNEDALGHKLMGTVKEI